MTRIRTMLPLLAVAALAAASLAVGACGDDDDEDAPATAAGSPAASGASADVKVGVQDNAFGAPVTVTRGGKVTWDWAGSQNPHSVIGTSDNAKTLLSSPVNQSGTGTYVVTFANAGTYDYMCGIHGASMTGKVVVQ